MKYEIRHVYTCRRLSVLFSLILGTYGMLFAQPVLTYSSSGACTFDIITSIANEPIDSLSGESSVGLFYRLDGLDKQGSYFWDTIIGGTNITTSKSLELPPGKFSLVAYQNRKGGPIKTGKGLTIINDSNTCPSEVLPTVFKEPEQRVKLSASWNVFSDPFYSYPPCLHSTTNEYFSPEDPWLFLTLSVKSWRTMEKDVSIYFDDINLDYVGAIAENYEHTQHDAWNFVEEVKYTPDSGQATIWRKSGVDFPLNNETHIHLIFKKGSEAFSHLPKIEFTAEYSYRIETDTFIESVSLSLPVKGAPHDPNSLEVDETWLCPCQANEWLTYRVNFQNMGTTDADTVMVFLTNDVHLYPASLKLLPDTALVHKTVMKQADIKYDPAQKMFLVTPIYLPGTAQVEPRTYENWETQDYFMFRIRKEDCLKSGTMIQPQVGIVFYKDSIPQDTIFTNLEKTEIVIENRRFHCQKSPHPSCTACKKKKPCWLLALFRKNKKTSQEEK